MNEVTHILGHMLDYLLVHQSLQGISAEDQSLKRFALSSEAIAYVLSHTQTDISARVRLRVPQVTDNVQQRDLALRLGKHLASSRKICRVRCHGRPAKNKDLLRRQKIFCLEFLIDIEYDTCLGSKRRGHASSYIAERLD